MEGEAKGKTFKMKGHTLPGINQRSEGNTDLADGRSKSSTFQQFNVAAQGMQAANIMRQQQGNMPGGGAMGGVGAGLGTPPIMSKPSMAKIYDKPKGKRTKY